MTAIVFANNVNTTLAAATSSTGTSFTLSSSSNLPVLAAGQIMPLTLNDAATGLIYEVVYVTAISGSVLTVERAQEGTTAQNWNVGDYAFSTNTAGTTQPQRLVYEPTAGGTLPAGNGVVVIPNLAAAATFTLPSTGLNVGDSGVIFGNNSYAVTVQTDVTTGSPAMLGPDELFIYSYTLPAGAGGGLRWVYDEAGNFRYSTFGPTVVADAVANNQAVALGQVLSVTPQYNRQVFTPASGDSYTISTTFTAPCNGFILAASIINVGSQQVVGCENSISINGIGYEQDDSVFPMTDLGAATVTAGTACTVTSTFTAGSSTGAFVATSQTVMSLFIPNP